MGSLSEEELFSEMKVILSSVAKGDALKIFNFAKDGIFNSSRTIKELGLSQKKYYTRLKELIEAGLIEKRDGTYHHTMLGSACHQLGKVFMNVLSQRDRLDLLTRLEGVKSLSSMERKKVAHALSIDEFGNVANLLSPVRMIDDYEDLVRETVGLIDRAESEVYLATQYFDIRVIEAILQGIKKGVNFSFLYNIADSNYERIRMMMKMAFSSSKVFKFFYEWVNSPDLKIRFVDLPYTFIVVDMKYVLVELLKPFADDFSLAFIFEHPSLCSQLLETFSFLWNKGSKAKSVIESLTKTNKVIVNALKRQGSKDYADLRSNPRNVE